MPKLGLEVCLPPGLWTSQSQESAWWSVHPQCLALCLAHAGAQETFAELKWKVSLLPTLSQPSVWDDKLCFQFRSGWIALFLMRNAENSKLLVLKNKPFSFRDLAQKWTVLTVQAPRLSLLLWSQRWWGFWLEKETRSPWPGPRAQSRSVCLAAPGPSWLPLQVGAGPAPGGRLIPGSPRCWVLSQTDWWGMRVPPWHPSGVRASTTWNLAFGRFVRGEV